MGGGNKHRRKGNVETRFALGRHWHEMWYQGDRTGYLRRDRELGRPVHVARVHESDVGGVGQFQCLLARDVQLPCVSAESAAGSRPENAMSEDGR